MSLITHPLSKPLLLAVAVMLGLSVSIITESNRQLHDVLQFKKHAELIAATGNLIHDLQIERGLSAFYLGSRGHASFKELLDARLSTDAKHRLFEKVLPPIRAIKNVSFDHAHEAVQAGFSKHAEIRKNIAAKQVSTRVSFLHYSSLIEHLLEFEQYLAQNTTTNPLHGHIAALRELSWSKERAGQLRALGSESFSSGHMTDKNHLLFIQLQAIQDARRAELRKLLSPELRANLDRIYNQPEMPELSRMQDLLMHANDNSALDPATAGRWFKLTTTHINRLKAFAVSLTSDLTATSIGVYREVAFRFYGLLALLFVVLTMTVAGLWRGEKEATRRSNDLQKSLRTEQERSQKILQTMAESVCVVGSNGNIEYTNPAMITTFGENTWRENAGDILPCVGSKGCALNANEFALAEGGCNEAHSIFTGRGYSIHCTPFRRTGERASRLIVLNDVTSHILTEQNLLHAKNAAENANLTKSQLLANMSHELRTPLNAIIGFSDLILNNVFGKIGNARYVECAYDIHSSGMHLLDLINDILDVSAIEAGKAELQCEPMNIGDVINVVVRLIKPRMKEGNITLALELSDQLPPFYGDVRRIKQILLNLLSNATKFTAANGTVTLRSQIIENGALQLFVSDNGVGMTEAEIKISLEQFGQADSGLNRKHEGTGLGLPLTKSLIELHGGNMVIESIKSRGTAVTVQFPPERTLTHEHDDAQPEHSPP